MSKKPKAELPGIGKATGQPRNRNVSSTRVWKRRRKDKNVAETPIFYCTIKLPGEKPLRRSTRRRNRSAAEEFAGLLQRQLMQPTPVHAASQEVQLELPPPHGVAC